MNTRFRKKPVIIYAFQVKKNNLKALETFVGSFGDSYKDNFQFIDQGADGASLKVNTLEGTSYNVQPNDWIIRGVNGEYYPCKPDIFEKTYELVTGTSTPKDEQDWSIPKDGSIDVPDELMPLFNQIGFQFKFVIHSGKDQVLAIAHIIQRAQKFFSENRQLLSTGKEVEKETKVVKCSKCGNTFEMPNTFCGKIVCEDCDPFLESPTELQNDERSATRDDAQRDADDQQKHLKTKV